MASRRLLPDLEGGKSIDFMICNGRNFAGGFGMRVDKGLEFPENGIDVLISANQISYNKELTPLMDKVLPLIRPANQSDARGRV